MRSAPRSGRGAVSRGALILIGLVVASGIVLGLFWWGTTFLRGLDDSELADALRADASPREVQHAIEELSRRFQEGRPGMDRWAEDLVRASRRSEEPVRISAAWCMQFDAARDAFRDRLHELVAEDPSPMVRRNAATSLAKSGDAVGLPVLRAMLEPFDVAAETGGVVRDPVGVETPVREGMRLATVETAGGRRVDVRAAVPGVVAERLADDGAAVAAGDVLLRLRPAEDHLTNAMYALGLVGGEEDLATVRSFADARSSHSEAVRTAATWAAERIAERLGR